MQENDETQVNYKKIYTIYFYPCGVSLEKKLKRQHSEQKKV